jgi:hypothetical protein
MKILIACECSGTVRRAFRALGHDAWSCDLKPAEDDQQFHIRGDAIAAMRAEWWDLVIAHPVCKYLANSGALRLYKGGKKENGRDLDRWAAMRDGAEFFRRFFFIGEYRGRLCLENPIMHGHGRDIIEGPGELEGVKTQTIQPFNFREDASKATVLWLRGLPYLKGTGYFKPRMVCRCGAVYAYGLDGCSSCGETVAMARPRWGNQTDSGQNRLGPSDHRTADRARTYGGIAEAMAQQWGAL